MMMLTRNTREHAMGRLALDHNLCPYPHDAAAARKAARSSLRNQPVLSSTLRCQFCSRELRTALMAPPQRHPTTSCPPQTLVLVTCRTTPASLYSASLSSSRAPCRQSSNRCRSQLFNATMDPPSATFSSTDAPLRLCRASVGSLLVLQAHTRLRTRNKPSLDMLLSRSPATSPVDSRPHVQIRQPGYTEPVLSRQLRSNILLLQIPGGPTDGLANFVRKFDKDGNPTFGSRNDCAHAPH